MVSNPRPTTDQPSDPPEPQFPPLYNGAHNGHLTAVSTKLFRCLAGVPARRQPVWGPVLALAHLRPDSGAGRAEGRPGDGAARTCSIPTTLASPLPTQQVAKGPVNRWASGHSQSCLPFSQQKRSIPCLTSSRRGGDMPRVHSPHPATWGRLAVFLSIPTCREYTGLM